MTIQISPVNDLVEHDRTGGALCDCVCGPDVYFLQEATYVVHHSLDGRELEEDE